jgi:hypothetical protein
MLFSVGLSNVTSNMSPILVCVILVTDPILPLNPELPLTTTFVMYILTMISCLTNGEGWLAVPPRLLLLRLHFFNNFLLFDFGSGGRFDDFHILGAFEEVVIANIV